VAGAGGKRPVTNWGFEVDATLYWPSHTAPSSAWYALMARVESIEILYIPRQLMGAGALD
jgi:hypothetical protein